MADLLSPGVLVKEIDLTNVTPAVSASIGAAVIEAAWGPVLETATIDSENVLVQRFGKPSDLNASNWFAAANFLGYSNNLVVVRSDTTNQRNAVSVLTRSISALPVTAGGTGYVQATTTVAISAPPVSGGLASIAVSVGGTYSVNPTIVLIGAPPTGGTQAAATVVMTGTSVTGFIITAGGSGYLSAPTVTINGTSSVPAVVGEILLTTGGAAATAAVVVTAGAVSSVSITNSGSGYVTSLDSTSVYYGVPTATLTAAVGTGAALSPVVTSQGGIKINNDTTYALSYQNGDSVVGEFAAKYPGSLGNSLAVSVCGADAFATWAYRGGFNSAPGTSSFAAANASTNDEIHIVVIDTNGKWSGTAGTVLERYAFLSKASDAKRDDGSGAYYKTVINTQSKYVLWMHHPVAGTNWGSPASSTAFTSLGSSALTRTLSGGVDHFVATDAQRIAGFDLFTNNETLDISLVIAGKADSTVANFVVQSVAEFRGDCVAFISPENVSTGEILIGNTSDIADKMIAFRNALPSSSFMVIDSGYKYQYDRYNDKYRWVPLNGDIAGVCARTDETNDPWFSPAGFSRGSIKNVTKLAFSPRKTDRDNLYKSNINPVVSFPGQGTVLYGDKTGQTKPSAFDRINVRRLFIILEKTIARASKYQLFELNDIQTRAQFRATIEPFLRDVQGRRGIYAFKVICDTSNNTQQVIDTNRFAASIYVAPAKSINFIELSFIATRTGVEFNTTGA
jgi:hypothetical protein